AGAVDGNQVFEPEPRLASGSLLRAVAAGRAHPRRQLGEQARTIRQELALPVAPGSKVAVCRRSWIAAHLEDERPADRLPLITGFSLDSVDTTRNRVERLPKRAQLPRLNVGGGAPQSAPNRVADGC